MALDALVELVGPLAVRVSVALALYGAVGAHVAEVAAAVVGLHAGAAHAALRAYGRAPAATRARRSLVPRAARALVPLRQVHANLNITNSLLLNNFFLSSGHYPTVVGTGETK